MKHPLSRLALPQSALESPAARTRRAGKALLPTRAAPARAAAAYRNIGALLRPAMEFPTWP
ncbi:hypothetical protein ACIGHN_03070 [Acidovorax sp. NPDC077693]|uniref:hypothetical protein n=1 Tax=unclassified Acidovorax TaxID=2684926 RepID=UPI0037C78A44